MAWDRFSTSSLAKIWVMLFAHGLLRKLQTRRDLRVVETLRDMLENRALPAHSDDLLDGHALRQVAGLVHVGAAAQRSVVGEQLHRNRVDDGREQARVPRCTDHVHPDALAEAAVEVGEDVEL